MSRVRGWLCGPKVFKFEGWLFEFPAGTGGPWPLNQDGDPAKRAGRKFYAMIKRFEALSDDQKKACREGGGCMRI